MKECNLSLILKKNLLIKKSLGKKKFDNIVNYLK